MIIVTSSDSPEDRREALRLDANYFRKSVSYEEFVKIGGALRRFLEDNGLLKTSSYALQLTAVLAALASFVLTVFHLLVLLLLAFFLGFGIHAVLGLVGVFVCHGVLLKAATPLFSRNCRDTR